MGLYVPRNRAHHDQFVSKQIEERGPMLKKGLYCYDGKANLRWKVCNPEPEFPIVPGGVILAPDDGVVHVKTADGRVGVALVSWP